MKLGAVSLWWLRWVYEIGDVTIASGAMYQTLSTL